MTERPDCERFRELASELALGVLTGRERAAALAHRDRCPACREHLAELTMVSDGLLALVPGTEPPVGFEGRVLRRLGIRQRAQRRRQWLLATAVAIVIAAVAGLGGWTLGVLTQSHVPASPVASAEHRLRTAQLVADHVQPGQKPVGQVFAYTGTPPWIYMTVDTDRGNDTVSCQLQTADGRLVSIGQFPLTHGYGYWGAPTGLDPAALVAARLVANDGTVIATARFTG